MAWNVFGRIATVTGFVDNLVSVSTVLGKTRTSPESSLTASWQTLEKIQSLLQGLSETRRRRIDIAAKNGLGKSLHAINEEFEDLRDRYCMAHTDYESSSYIKQYIPSEEFRKRVEVLESNIKALLMDTMATTVSCLDESQRAALENPVGNTLADSSSTGSDVALQDLPRTPRAPGGFENV